ncbi:MAG: oligoendopeptidase F [Terrisporobacter othiniensis]|uniref:oligoendopeptidase F n=1 Tax=Terrisporobacter petrolearius TaxID=1460447 RepID=UPI0008DF719A|nr:oligoendopeptidase F [Terrisporobacter petrolearius]MDU4861302.1 oligoendopeptidase F [Terrisporobacter othiniensis]MDU6994936.1 oligoendopeptidase F [Terrisporobacter othiniensis]SFJ55559.1 oligoendopeptidase F [Terrisporobacter glycolicus]
MGRKLLKLLIVLLLLFGIYTERQDIYNGCVTVFAQDEKDEEKPKKEIDYNKYCWNLYTLYKNDDAWSRDLKKFNQEMNELENYTGKLTKSKTHLSLGMGIKEKLDIKLNSLSAYAKLKKDLNKNSYEYLNMTEEIKKSYSRYMKITSQLELEILKLSDKDCNKYLSDKKINSKYGMYIKDIRRNKKHYLDDKSENILSNMSSINGLPSNIYDLFRNMDKKTNITPAEYENAIQDYNREKRVEAYKNEFLPYNDNVNTLAGLLSGQVNKNVFYSSVRNYDSSLQMYLDSDDVDEKVYKGLIKTVSKNTDSLHKYVSLRKKVLNLDKVYYYDMFVPIVSEGEEVVSYDKAQGMVYSALAPLGDAYGSIVYKAFNERWVDVYSKENKVSGGYCLSVYDNHPYILLNYNSSIGGVSTLVHELGHGVYEYLSTKNQNFYNSSPSIFTHEVASTTNEVLLYENLIKNAKNNKEKAYYISMYLDFIKNTLYTQTMYAEFEDYIHEAAENNKQINALVLNDKWSMLLKKYYGDDFEVDPLSMVGWARIPHFYNSFYVYKYATGCCSAVTCAQDILKNGPDNYLNFLKKGGSDYPLNLLKSNNVDLNSQKPIKNTIDKFDQLVSELEKLLEE